MTETINYSKCEMCDYQKQSPNVSRITLSDIFFFRPTKLSNNKKTGYKIGHIQPKITHPLQKISDKIFPDKIIELNCDHLLRLTIS